MPRAPLHVVKKRRRYEPLLCFSGGIQASTRVAHPRGGSAAHVTRCSPRSRRRSINSTCWPELNDEVGVTAWSLAKMRRKPVPAAHLPRAATGRRFSIDCFRCWSADDSWWRADFRVHGASASAAWLRRLAQTAGTDPMSGGNVPVPTASRELSCFYPPSPPCMMGHASICRANAARYSRSMRNDDANPPIHSSHSRPRRLHSDELTTPTLIVGWN